MTPSNKHWYRNGLELNQLGYKVRSSYVIHHPMEQEPRGVTYYPYQDEYRNIWYIGKTKVVQYYKRGGKS